MHFSIMKVNEPCIIQKSHVFYEKKTWNIINVFGLKNSHSPQITNYFHRDTLQYLLLLTKLHKLIHINSVTKHANNVEQSYKLP